MVLIDRFTFIFLHSINCQFLFVTGGYDGSSGLDSTEVLNDGIWMTVNAKLSSPISALRIASINNRVLSFGNLI